MHRSLGFFALSVLLEGCAHDAAGPGAGANLDPPSRMFVSNSRSAASAAASVAPSISSGSAAHPNTASRTIALAADEGNVAYISLQPQTNPGGVSAVISNLRLGASITAPMLDGGMDPVPLPASTGDSVRIEIQNASGVTIETLSSRVLSKRPPKIVRTSPGRGKTGVPLNKNIEVVFTEPVASLSLSSSVQLFRGATQVAGTAENLQGVTASVVFRPAALLEANTDYELVITQGVRDLDGDALDSEERVPFRTGTAKEGLLASLILIPDGANVRVGDQFQLVVIAKDAEGTVLTGHPITWSVDDSTVAHLSTTGLVTARKEGRAIVLAEVDGDFIGMFVNVSNAMHPVASVTVSVDSASVSPSGTLSVAAVARDAEGNFLAFRVARWTTANTAVAAVAATVSNQVSEPFNGYFVTSTALYRAEVTGVANGVTMIIASVEGKSDTIVVTVASSPPPIVGLVMSTDTATLLLRETTRLAGSSVNSDGGRASLTGTQVQWETSNPAVATVDATGAVTGVGEGSATITGRWNNYSASAQITVVQIAFETINAGGSHTCALASGGVTYCWGASGFGQSGKPGYIFGGLSFQAWVFTPTPSRVAEGLFFVALTTGGFHTCAMTATGSVYCWGFNGYGALGTNDLEDSWRPRLVPAGSFSMIDAGTHHTCALMAAGAAYCWGSNRSGQLGVGNGGPISSALPARVVGGIPFTSLSAGGSHTCALTADGTAYCWGQNAGGQLGVGENVTSSPTPLRVSGLTFASITAGEAHTCGVTRSGTLYCWGWNFENQLGNGVQTTLSSVPVAVASSANFAAVGTGAAHTCAIDVSGVGYCWGQNLAGQIGVGSVTSELFATPQSIVGGLSLEKVSAGRSHTCAATTAGVWYCWGDNEAGVLGVGNTTDSGSPLKVLGQR